MTLCKATEWCVAFAVDGHEFCIVHKAVPTYKPSKKKSFKLPVGKKK